MNLIAQAIVEVIEEIIMIKHLATIIIFISFIGSALNCAIYCADEFKELNAAKKMTKVISIDAHKMLGVPLICSAIMFKKAFQKKFSPDNLFEQRIYEFYLRYQQKRQQKKLAANIY